MALPKFQTKDTDLQLMQSAWAAQINPVLGNPITQGTLIRNVALVTGANAINHKLGRALQGWVLTRQRASAAVYDTQDTNTHPELTLNLISSAPIVADIYVF
jgi:hypothetical protein